MANQIALDLLKQAKQYLVEGKYAEAVKASTGVIALDEGNSEAKDILTAAEAALGSKESTPRETDAYEQEAKSTKRLRQVAIEVQKALDAKKMFDATKLVEDYLAEFPNIPGALKMLADVKRAHGVVNSQREQQWRKNQVSQGASLPSTGSRGTGHEVDAGCLNYGLSFLLASFLGLLIQYVLRKQGWTAVGINAVIFVIMTLWLFETFNNI